MLYVDVKYANLISSHSRIRNYKKLGENIWRFSCFYCGDSTKIKTKARGFIIRKDSKLFYKCHNCGVSKSFGYMLRDLDQFLFKEYSLEIFKEKSFGYTPVKKQLEPLETEASSEVEEPELADLISVNSLSENHPVRLYVVNRKIPKTQWNRLFFVKKFKKFANNLKENCIKNTNNDHPRLVIPFFDKSGKMFAFQGRAFGNEKPKYITVKIDESAEKLFGLDYVDFSKQIYVTEGPIDSLFLPNALAVAGGAVNSKTLLENKERVTVIMDNEPRNKQISKQVEKCIELGYSVCLFPQRIQYKDINDMIKGGMTESQVLQVIQENTFSGLVAKVRYSMWRK